MTRRLRTFANVAAIIVLASCTSIRSTPLSDVDQVPEELLALPMANAESGIRPPKVIRRVQPITTPELRSRGRLTATVHAVVNTEGRVDAVWYMSGDREWAAALAVAVREWRFEPARQNGQPVAVRYEMRATATSTPIRW